MIREFTIGTPWMLPTFIRFTPLTMAGDLICNNTRHNTILIRPWVFKNLHQLALFSYSTRDWYSISPL